MQMVENKPYYIHAMGNPYIMNYNTPMDGTLQQPIARSNWRSGNGVVGKPKSVKRWTRSHINPNYGSVKAMSNVTGAWNVQKKVEFHYRNKSLWSKSFKPRNEKKFNGCGRFKQHTQDNASLKIHSAKKERAIDSAVTPDKWSELVKEWGLDLHGSMMGLIRLRSPFNECVDIGYGGPSCTGDKEDIVQLETKLVQDLSRYELILPNSVTSLRFDGNLKTDVGEGKFHQTSQLEDENLILKQRLFVMGKDMDDLKRRMEQLEKQFRVNENGSGDDVERFIGSVDVCKDEANVEVESDNDSGGTLRKIIPDISDAIVASHRNYTVGIELDKSHDKQVECQHNDKVIGENGVRVSDHPALL